MHDAENCEVHDQLGLLIQRSVAPWAPADLMTTLMCAVMDRSGERAGSDRAHGYPVGTYSGVAFLFYSSVLELLYSAKLALFPCKACTAQ